MKPFRAALTIALLITTSACTLLSAQPAAPAEAPAAAQNPAGGQTVLMEETSAPHGGLDGPVIPDPDLLAEFGYSQAEGFSLVPPPADAPLKKTALGPALPVDPGKVTNLPVAGGLAEEQKAALWKDGFTVAATGEAQFVDIRKQVSELYGQPYFLTTDAAFHALHLTFDELLKALEKERFLPMMKQITRRTLETVQGYKGQAAGNSLEADAALAQAYLGVGLKLLDPTAALDPEVEKAIAPQLAQIKAEGGRELSKLIPGFEDDYGAYRPVGHYAGDPALENYFRAMTWFGRVQFQLASTAPNFKPSRAPLLITLALRDKGSAGQAPAADWGSLQEVLSMMIGPVDDGSPLEYAALMDAIYGKGHGVAELKDEEKWQRFVASRAALPAPQINSTFANSLADMASEHGWRFSGQRFTMDSFFLQNLVFNKVGTREKPRKLPTGLDVMVILGSAPAQKILEEIGETGYAKYPEQQAAMKKWLADFPADAWWKTFYTTWLHAFQSQVTEKGDAYPPFMRGEAWANKELNTGLGSWAELKHDTALYTKMPEFAGGGGPPSSGPAPAFVEPNPDAFYRMSYAIQNLADGLTLRGMNLSLEPAQPGDFAYPRGVDGLIYGSELFGETLEKLGDIAAKELDGQELTVSDYGMIQGCLGPVECQVLAMQNNFEHGVGEGQEMPAVPVVAAVAGAEDKILEAGVGPVNRVYVVVPLEGGLEIAQGGVFSYYEFVQPRDDRLTDQAWREKLASGAVEPPQWTNLFVSIGGKPVDVLAMRPGDWYLITQAGDDLNVRAAPGKQGALKGKLHKSDYVEIVEGPQVVGGARWWKIRMEYADPALEGWVIEEEGWFERAHGQ